MTAKQRITTRKEKNRDLFDRDARNRCAWCKVSLLGQETVVQSVEGAEVFCSDGCRKDRIAWRDRG